MNIKQLKVSNSFIIAVILFAAPFIAGAQTDSGTFQLLTKPGDVPNTPAAPNTSPVYAIPYSGSNQNAANPAQSPTTVTDPSIPRNASYVGSTVQSYNSNLLPVSNSNNSAPAAQSNQSVPTTPAAASDPTQSAFRIVVCDGPATPSANQPVQEYDNQGKPSGTHPYVACDFNGAMLTVQHLINVFLVLGVFAAIILCTYAGFLLMTGREADRKKAKEIFPKIGIGFLVMLAAWFIVFQILNWLTGNPMFTKLLGS